MSSYTKGPWFLGFADGSGAGYITDSEGRVVVRGGWNMGVQHGVIGVKNARLIAAAPTQHQEMLRYLPLIEAIENDPEVWDRLTAGMGLATANSYRKAISLVSEEAE